MDERWPELDYTADRPVIESLHAYLQLIGKLPTRGLAWLNHGWHTALRVVPRGFRTYPVPLSEGEGELLLDCLEGCIRLDTSLGVQRAVGLVGDLERRQFDAGIELERPVGSEMGDERVPRVIRLASRRHIPFGTQLHHSLSRRPERAVYQRVR